jgi:hypothetical protein
LPDAICCALLRHPVVLDEYPHINVTPPVSFAAGDTPVQYNAEDIVELVEEIIDSDANWLVELCLRDVEKRIIRPGQPTRLDVDETRGAVSLFDDKIIFR